MTQHNTPASMYIRSREFVGTFSALHEPMKTALYVDRMCACIAELESNVPDLIAKRR